MLPLFKALRVPLAAALVAFVVSPASAATLTSDGSCSVGDITGTTADACWGLGEPAPLNDDETLLNTNVFHGDGTDDGTLGLFDRADWDYAQKDDGTLETDIDVSLVVNGLNASSGSWTANLSAFEEALVILKAGNTFAAYLFTNAADANSGSWATASGKALSHFSIYVRGTATPIPVPAGGLLLLTGLAGLGFAARRKRG